MNNDVSHFFPDSEDRPFFCRLLLPVILCVPIFFYLSIQSYIYIYIHGCMHPFFHLWIRYLEGVPSFVIFSPFCLIKHQGDICLCQPHVWAAKGSWSHHVCGSAPRQMCDLSPVVFLQAAQSVSVSGQLLLSSSSLSNLHPSPQFHISTWMFQGHLIPIIPTNCPLLN